MELKGIYFSSWRSGLILCKIHYFYAHDLLQEVAHNLEAAGVGENWKQILTSVNIYRSEANIISILMCL